MKNSDDSANTATGIPDPDNEPSKVLIYKETLVDRKRQDRPVPIKAYYPETDGSGKHPVIFWSHGLGGTRDGASFLARFVASHGYIVINVQHLGTDSILWEGKPGHPWDNIRQASIPRKASLNRFRDIPFVVDTLERTGLENESLNVLMDLDKLGISGHSFGALTTQVLAGQKLGRSHRMYSLRDSRFKAGIAYSPSATYNRAEDPLKLYGDIALPMLYMTGTEDSSPVTGDDYTHRLQIFEKSSSNLDRPAPQTCLVLDNADHMVFAGSRGKLGHNTERRRHENIIKLGSLLYWNAVFDRYYNFGEHDALHNIPFELVLSENDLIKRR